MPFCPHSLTDLTALTASSLHDPPKQRHTGNVVRNSGRLMNHTMNDKLAIVHATLHGESFACHSGSMSPDILGRGGAGKGPARTYASAHTTWSLGGVIGFAQRGTGTRSRISNLLTDLSFALSVQRWSRTGSAAEQELSLASRYRSGELHHPTKVPRAELSGLQCARSGGTISSRK